jgi:hypothetical protein
VAACGSDSTSPVTPTPPATPNGNYAMATVNGQPLPFATAHDSLYTYEVTNGSLSLANDGTFSVITTWRQTIPGNVEIFVDSNGGNWTKSGSTITLNYSFAQPADTATWAGSQLTFVVTNTSKVTTTTVYMKK